MVFIIPVKSAVISPSWKKFSRLVDRCLRSVCQQTDQDFKVVVVCNEKPITDFEHPNVHYHYVDFEPPTAERVEEVRVQAFNEKYNAKEADKSKRILAGLEYARQFNMNHVMVVDADDCIDKNIVKYVKQHPDENGWYSNKGYVYKEGSKLIFKKLNKFNSLCGTCLIVKPEHISSIIDSNMYYRHPKTELDNGVKLKPLPFPAAVYTINGENYFMTDKAVTHLKSVSNSRGLMDYVKRILRYRVYLLGHSVKSRFGLYPVT